MSGDRLVLEKMEEAGADLARPHEVGHYFYAATSQQAEALAEPLCSAGLRVKVSKGLDEKWCAYGAHWIVPEIETLLDLRERFAALAEKHGAEYDGWEAAIVPGGRA
jgi:hypothetical protein